MGIKLNWIIVVSFVSVCAKELLLEKTLCETNCIQYFNKTQIYDEICKTKCNGHDNIQGDETNVIHPWLHCVTKDSLSVAWEPWNQSVAYLVEIRNNKTLEWTVINMTRFTNMSFTDLEADTDYQVQVWGFESPEVNQSLGRLLGSRLTGWLSTFSPYFIPHPVENISLAMLSLQDGKFKVKVEWIPNAVYPACHYDLVLFYGQRYKVEEYRELLQSFETEFDDLDFEMDVAVMITSKNGEEESNKTEISFSTPSCLEVIKNLTFCAPAMPLGLTAEEVAVQIVPVKHTTYYDITLHWNRPEYFPDYYRAVLSSLNLYLNETVPGNATRHVFRHVEVGLNYMVRLKAVSAGGESDPAVLHRQSTHSTVTSASKFVWVLTIVAVIALSFLLTFGAGLFMLHRRAKRKRYERRCKYFEELDGKSPKNMECITSDTGLILEECQPDTDKWDIVQERLILQSVLGEGAFGLVRRAWLRDEQGNASTEVAVKMLKDAPSCEQIRQFMHEIEIMKTVGAHPHLVSLIGCSRRGVCMMLVVEFCALGDLQNYLRSAWEKMTSPPEPQTLQYADLMSDTNSEGSTHLIINKLYDIEANDNLKASDLLSFARQIAVGMEFLASMRVLHRDLAARNVLVCSDKTVKIADFGLSRDVYKENMYRKSGNGKLPIRWMALESLTHQIYTSQSDVWSFGILLWEIVTLGGNPYPSIPTNALLKFLKSGYRMERPTNCGPELYSVMLSCWKERPKDRPTFTELRKSLDALLESVTTSKYLDLDVLTSTEFASFRAPLRENSSISVKNRSRSSDVILNERYVHPVLLNNVKNSSGNMDLPIIIK